MRLKHALTCCLFGLVAACSGQREYRAAHSDASVPPPLELAGTAFEAAASLELPEEAPEELPGLHHVYRLSENVISGAEPNGVTGLRQLQQMGVRTIVSVDGKLPDSVTAASLGMRYVHIPIHYKGITGDELTRLAKTFRELDAPFYVHCFHGKHRGPAAAAIGRIVLDGVPRAQALAEMRQWCATSEKYEGLYRVVASAPLPEQELTSVYAFDFTAAHRYVGVRGGMIGLARKWDLVKAAEQRDWQVDPSHPDVDPVQEVTQLGELYTELCELEELAERSDEFRGWMDQGRDASERLLRALGDRELAAKSPGPTHWQDDASEAYLRLADSCASCHATYRND